MTLRRCHYLHQKGSDLADRLNDFTRPALCGRTQWGAVSGKISEVDCKACLKRIAKIRAEAAKEVENQQRLQEVARMGAASYALGRMFRQHGRARA